MEMWFRDGAITRRSGPEVYSTAKMSGYSYLHSPFGTQPNLYASSTLILCSACYQRLRSIREPLSSA